MRFQLFCRPLGRFTASSWATSNVLGLGRQLHTQSRFSIKKVLTDVFPQKSAYVLSNTAYSRLVNRSLMMQRSASRPQLSKTLSPAVPSNQTRFYQHWYQKKSGWRYYKYQYYDRFNLPSENAIYALIATFVGVYALKSFVPGFPDLSYSKDKSFIYLFTSSFDHADLGHLFTNCFFIYFMGSMFPASISAATVFAIFTLGGAGGSFLFEMYSSYQARRALAKGNILRYNMEQRSRSCGASGGIFSLLALETLMAPFRPILFMGIVPMRSWVFFVGLVGLDFAQVVYKEIRSEQGYPPSGRQIGNGAHIGGAFMGTVFYFLMRRLRMF